MKNQHDEKVKKLLKRAREIGIELGLIDAVKKTDEDAGVTTGIAAMLQMEMMQAPMIVMNNEGEAMNLHIDRSNPADKDKAVVSEFPVCSHCHFAIAVRQGDPECDHLYYPENCRTCRDRENTTKA